MIEVLKQMVEALEWCHGGEPIGTAEAIQAGKQAIAELESQEPFAYVNVEMRRLEFATDYVKWDTPTTIKLDKIPLYTHLPQRTWVGLTDDEHCDIWYKESLDWMEYGKAIEAKLKQKNGFAEENT